jgi:ABC-type uncharacterized transport system permease subunit
MWIVSGPNITTSRFRNYPLAYAAVQALLNEGAVNILISKEYALFNLNKVERLFD